MLDTCSCPCLTCAAAPAWHRQMSGASSLPEVVPSSSWEIKPTEIEIAKHPDGSDWEIGHGGFGKVRPVRERHVFNAAGRMSHVERCSAMLTCDSERVCP